MDEIVNLASVLLNKRLECSGLAELPRKLAILSTLDRINSLFEQDVKSLMANFDHQMMT